MRGPQLLILGAALAACPGSSQRPDSDELDVSVLDGSKQRDSRIYPRDRGGESGPYVTGTNPVIPDRADPHVLRTIGEDGKPIYYLTATVQTGDLPLYSSRDLVSWKLEPKGLFQRTTQSGSSLEINGRHYCAIWAPQIVELDRSYYLLSFTATRFDSPRSPCPGYNEDSGVYLASATRPEGPYALSSKSWEPLPAGGHITDCPTATRQSIPHSLDLASRGCQGTYCHQIIRLDSDVFVDPQTSRAWMAYSWYTNSPPMVDWEKSNYGEHVEIVELDAKDPFTVRCQKDVPQIHAANPHDQDTLQALGAYCSRCKEMLSFSRGRMDEQLVWNGYLWGITEGAHLFRRGSFVYLLVSGSLWDSAYYHTYWVAAKSVEDLAYTSKNRILGRYLIPSQDQSFGHGTVVLGPDNESYYFIHHRLSHGPCKAQGKCIRDVWVSPVEFETRDALGPVYIKPRFPAEDPTFTVRVP